LVLRVQLVLELKVHRELQELRVFRALQEQELKVHREQVVRQELRVFRALQEQEHKELRVLLDIEVVLIMNSVHPLQIVTPAKVYLDSTTLLHFQYQRYILMMKTRMVQICNSL
jgi:hypothetical protein